MPTYEYQALTTGGQRVRGSLAGVSEQAVVAELESRSLVPVTITPAAEPRRARRRLSARKLGTAYQQLSDLLRAGVPLLRGLKLLGGRKSDPSLASVFRELAEAVETGGELSEAMGQKPETFAPIHVAMVRAGEKGGFLETVLARLGALVIAQAELRGKVIGSLVYPGILVSVGVIVMAVIFTVFVPKFRVMLDAMQSTPPVITRLVLGLSDALTSWKALLVVGALVGLVVGALWALRRPDVRARVEVWRVRAPVVGPLTRAIGAARFCRTLGTMLANNVPMLAALQISKDAAGNAPMREAIERAADAVRQGEPLAAPLSASGLFDDDIIEMISVGEAANNLDDVLVQIAATVEARVERLLTTAVRLIEPLLLVSIAGVVFAVAVALVLPMTQMSGKA
jgi:general secretion pathway protein F/type IV pilus assembly protein PilC